MQRLLLALARDAGEILLRGFEKKRVTNLKERKDIVTDMDVRIERRLITAIHKHYPRHSILSEEVGPIERDPEYLWVIDPLDGTVNYAAGIPLFSVSIGIVHNGEPTHGVVNAPYLRELFAAERGKGATMNGRRIRPSKTTKLDEAMVHLGLSAHFSPQLIAKNWRIAKTLSTRVRGLRMLDSGALTSCYVANGRLDGKVSIKTNAFGNAASTVIIEEAGGVVCDFDGKRWNVNMKDMICSNRTLSGILRRLVH